MKRFTDSIRTIACAPAMYSLFLIHCSLMSSCQESWQERLERETREMSIRDCPHYLTPGLIVDSLSFVPAENARHTYYTFVDSLIDMTLVTPDNMAEAHRSLADEIRNSIELRTMKEHRCTFHFHYRLQSDGSTIFNDSVTAEEYARQ